MWKHLFGDRINWIRASVLGANDGIVSIASLLVGFAGAAPTKSYLLVAGTAGVVSGALSMGVGEYVSVSSQRDVEREDLKLSRNTLTNPWHAAIASALSFTLGALIPLIAVIVSPQELLIFSTFAASLLALIITGSTSGYMSRTNVRRATLRVTLGGALAMGITLGIGTIIGSVIR
jgi:vacuolar iron transporter family protein